MDLPEVVADIGDALLAVDTTRPIHKKFSAGIGPFGEAIAVKEALAVLRQIKPNNYESAVIKKTPDLLIPGEWALEFKIIRPFGDNGMEAEHWSENILHPYRGNTSSLGDCIKLLESGLPERKAVIMIGYEHTPPRIQLEPAIASFETIAAAVLSLRLGKRVEEARYELVHHVHQQLKVYGFEILGQS